MPSSPSNSSTLSHRRSYSPQGLNSSSVLDLGQRQNLPLVLSGSRDLQTALPFSGVFTKPLAFASDAISWVSPLVDARTQVDSFPDSVTPTARSVGPPISSVVSVAIDAYVVGSIYDNAEARSKCSYSLLLCPLLSGVLGFVILLSNNEDKSFNEKAFFVAEFFGAGGLFVPVKLLMDKCLKACLGSDADFDSDPDSDSESDPDSDLESDSDSFANFV